MIPSTIEQLATPRPVAHGEVSPQEIRVGQMLLAQSVIALAKRIDTLLAAQEAADPAPPRSGIDLRVASHGFAPMPAPATEAKCLLLASFDCATCGATISVHTDGAVLQGAPRAGASEVEPVALAVVNTHGHDPIIVPVGLAFNEKPFDESVMVHTRKKAWNRAEEIASGSNYIPGCDAEKRHKQNGPYRVVPLYARPTPPPAEGVEAKRRAVTDAAKAWRANPSPIEGITPLVDAVDALLAAERAERGTGGGGE